VAEPTDSKRKQIRQSKAASTTGEYLLLKSSDFSLLLRTRHRFIRKRKKNMFLPVK
jgi:hypothetical protein